MNSHTLNTLVSMVPDKWEALPYPFAVFWWGTKHNHTVSYIIIHIKCICNMSMKLVLTVQSNIPDFAFEKLW